MTLGRHPWYPLGVAVSLAGSTGVVVTYIQLSIAWLIVIAVAAACIAIPIKRILDRNFDLFEPIVLFNAALFAMYVIRPAGMLITGGDFQFKGYDIRATFQSALIAAVLATVCAQLGYLLPVGRRLALRLPVPNRTWDIPTTSTFALGLAGLGIVGFLLFLHQTGLPLEDLIRGRSSSQDAYFRDSSAYLYAAPVLFWPASLLFIAAGLSHRRRDLVVVGVLLMVPLTVLAAGQGSRIELMPLFVSPLLFWYLARDRRPSVLVLGLAFYLFFSVGIAFLRDTRTATEHINRLHELKTSLIHPEYEYRQLMFHGVDDDMFESLATEMIVVPSVLKQSPLDFLERTLAKPVPRVLWHSKPLEPEELLTRTLYPNEETRASSSEGVVGSLFLAGGYPCIAIGMLFIGTLFRVPWEYWRRHREAPGAQLFFIVSAMYIPILLRGAIGDTLARLLFGLIPVFIAIKVCEGRRMRSGTARRAVTNV